jgi:hypothetical protein
MESPYPIYFNKRLVKTIFIVNPKDFNLELFKSIFDVGTRHYGGRFNPIVFSDGKDLSKEAWEFIKDFDPDTVIFLVKPQKKLIQKIEDRLSPYVVQISDPKRGISFYDQLPSIYRPTQDLIREASTYHFDEKKPFVFFNMKDVTSEKLKEFVHLNFGTYEEYFLNQMGEKVEEKKTIILSDEKSVSDALLELGNIHKSFVFPIQLCSIPNDAKDVGYDSNNENFTVIVGDSPYDLLHYWNRILVIPQWIRKDICHFWLSTEIAEDEKLKEGLQQFFQQRASRTGNNNNGGNCIQFISFSLKEDRLKKIADTLGEKAWCYKKTIALTPQEIFPNYGQNKDYFSLKQGMSLYQAYGNEETVVVEDPKLPSGVQGGNWMLDVYMQYRPERYQYTNIRHWWRLPNRNHLTRIFFPHRIARIQNNGIPSVVMESKSSFKPDAGKLDIKIPEDGSVIRSLVFGQNRPVYNGDPRISVIDTKTYLHTQRSDKGRYLQGVISLFGGLGQAYHQFREPYWRRMFEILSLSTPTSDNAKKIVIFNKLKKALKNEPKNATEREDELKWLSEYILLTSKEHGKSGREANFDFFLNEKIKLIQEFLKAQGKSEKIDKKRGLQFKEEVYSEIKDLVDNNILLMGLKPHCSSCGYANWLHVDELKQKIECEGCGTSFDLAPETSWLYRLNSLVESGVRQHGLVPVLLTLGELQDEARSSFIYSPSLDLHKKIKRGYKHLGDLDIVCIQDGKFIIGEIKQSSSLFKKTHFEDAFKIAKQIKPNVVLFSSFDGKKTKAIDDGIKFLKEKLEPLGIKVVWYEARGIYYIY